MCSPACAQALEAVLGQKARRAAATREAEQQDEAEQQSNTPCAAEFFMECAVASGAPLPPPRPAPNVGMH